MSDKKSVFIDPKDDLSKSWVESVIRGRLARLSEGNIFCLGPPGENNIIINDQRVCANNCIVKTHVRNEFVAFCKDHIIILHKYTSKKPNK